jgi:rubrerythrin
MKIKSAFITLAAVAALSFVTSCGSSSEKEEEAEAVTEQVVEDVKYQCPMKCEGDKTYDAPGNCPVCKMELKKLDS